MDDNLKDFLQLFKDMGVTMSGVHGDACCHDPCKLASQWNGAVNEMNFAQSLVKGSEFVLDWSPVNIIDTGRNGVDDARQDCANWCNPRNMGAGAIPTTSTGNEMVDAFFWLKTPGESDGCTQELPDGTQCHAMIPCVDPQTALALNRVNRSHLRLGTGLISRSNNLR